MEVIRNVLIELRSRLRSCNVFLMTNIDFTKNCQVNVNIQANTIIVNYCPAEVYDDFRCRKDSLSSVDSSSDCFSDDENVVTEIIRINEFCHVIPNSISGLKVEKSNLSFRVLTEPHDGNFFKEVIQSDTVNFGGVKKFNVTLSIKDNVKLVCSNCKNDITESVAFDRILELPSENIDAGAWFCHSHEASSSDVLKPRKCDLFYRLTHFVINVDILTEKIMKFNSKRVIVHCNRCLAWLGLKFNEEKSVKLFNDTVKYFNQNMEVKSIFQSMEMIDDLVYTIEYLSHDFNKGMQYTVMCKILMSCQFSSSCSKYILIWIMDKKLEILKSSSRIDGEIALKNGVVMKILYKIEVERNDLVESWLSDSYTICIDVSKGMFGYALEHFDRMSKIIPESFRESNGFYVSYLKL